MFLHLLEGEEKENFLELAYIVANYNDDFAEEQKALISQYRIELGLFEDVYKITNKKLADILNSFNNSRNEIKNAVFVEIMALIYSDGVYDELEREIASKIMENLDISKEKCSEVIMWIQEIRDLYSKGNNLINS